ncbi:universal stress protein [Bacillaceae bacterium S4-13-56]
MMEYNNIIVAVDGSKASEKAFDKAIYIAKRNHARLIISHVIDTRAFATVEAYDRTLAERAVTHADELLQEYKNQALNQGIEQVDTDIEYGSPKIKIAKEVAPKFEADLIICGATGLNAMERFFIGSVSEHVTRYAACDVLIVRNSSDEEKK